MLRRCFPSNPIESQPIQAAQFAQSASSLAGN